MFVTVTTCPLGWNHDGWSREDCLYKTVLNPGRDLT